MNRKGAYQMENTLTGLQDGSTLRGKPGGNVMRRGISHTIAIILLLLAVLPLLVAPARAAETAVAPDWAPGLEQFLDDTITTNWPNWTSPARHVAVVADGQLLLAKGYGHADQAQNRPVDGERTLFRTGSVGKLITWTAVMQLVEQGRLDLHADVNDYLDFTIPAAFPEPITLAHLMTHTAGFADQGEALFVLSEEKMMPLRQYLVELQPDRVFPPGGAGVLQLRRGPGRLHCRAVSGEPFADYVETHIFAPLEWPTARCASPRRQLRSDLADWLWRGRV
jgi:CubicO group peptidase (beta-lactamase class C family)